jgi:hypothetical protein
MSGSAHGGDERIAEMTTRMRSMFLALANLAVFVYALGAPRKWM